MNSMIFKSHYFNEDIEDENDINFIMYQNYLTSENTPTYYLSLNTIEDPITLFEIKYDIYEGTYLYFLAQEKDFKDKNRTIAPFYFNTSFQIDELYLHNKIFRYCGGLDEVKLHFDEMFKNKKIFLKYGKNEKNEETLKMNISCYFISRKYSIELELEKKMIPPSKKNKELCRMYLEEKKNMLKLKEIYSLIYKRLNENMNKGKNKMNENEKNILEQLIFAFSKYKITGIDLEDLSKLNPANDINNINKLSIIKENENEEEEVPILEKVSNYFEMINYQFLNYKDCFEVNLDNNKTKNSFVITLLNKGKFTWPYGQTSLVCNESQSEIKCEQIEDINYECQIDQDIDFKIGVKTEKVGVFNCTLNLKIGEKIFKDKKITIDIIVTDNNLEKEIEKIRKEKPKLYNTKGKKGLVIDLINQ